MLQCRYSFGRAHSMAILIIVLAISIGGVESISRISHRKLGISLRGKSFTSLISGSSAKAHQNFSIEARIACQTTSRATAESDKYSRCPADCPLWVADTSDDQHCNFQCIPSSVAACKRMNPLTPVPDPDQGVCRSCNNKGCKVCAEDGTDTCVACKNGFVLLDNGKCVSPTVFSWYLWMAVLVLFVVFLATWIWSLLNRPVSNPDGLQRGLATRSFSKLRMSASQSESQSSRSQGSQGSRTRHLWPFKTNLMVTPAAGPGVLHLFCFNFSVILWAIGVALAWLFLALVVDIDFLRLGIRSPGRTERGGCIVVAWGYVTQQRLMAAKVNFVFVLYVVTTLLAIGYSIRQARKHQALDENRSTHKDFCAMCRGVPRVKGDTKIEFELRDALAEKTGQPIIGVSICWDFEAKEGRLMKMVEYDTEELRHPDHVNARRKSQGVYKEQMQTQSRLTSFFFGWESFVLSPATQRIVKRQHGCSAMTRNSIQRQYDESKLAIDEEDNQDEEVDTVLCEQVCDDLRNLYTTEEAYVVFNTEEARDMAIRKSEAEGGFEFQGAKLFLTEATCEPESINWANCSNHCILTRVLRLCRGFGIILIALAVWTFGFYYPYANVVMQSDYAHGRDPSVMARTVFGFVVVGGNALMYAVCAEVSHRVRFKYDSQREVCYMLTYCFACVFNVCLDIAIAYNMAFRKMSGLGMTTYDGRRLSELDTSTERFETYAMQKSLGALVLAYSFPSTFLVPYIAEPFAVIFGPLKISSLLVGSNPAIVGAPADALLASTPMDLSRYADILLNLCLTALMFFFPGGYVVPIMLGLLISQLYLYFYDHYRVLRSIPATEICTYDVEWWAQWMLSFPCAMLLVCVAFKGNCQSTLSIGTHCWKSNTEVIEKCAFLFVCHIVLHTLVLIYIVPLFHRKQVARSHDYRECAESHPASWFAMNPVHCLRTKWFYDESDYDPPCDYYVTGKDHLLRQNEKQGLYYHADTPRIEVYDEHTIMTKSYWLGDYGLSPDDEGDTDQFDKESTAIKIAQRRATMRGRTESESKSS